MNFNLRYGVGGGVTGVGGVIVNVPACVVVAVPVVSVPPMVVPEPVPAGMVATYDPVVSDVKFSNIRMTGDRAPVLKLAMSSSATAGTSLGWLE